MLALIYNGCKVTEDNIDSDVCGHQWWNNVLQIGAEKYNEQHEHIKQDEDNSCDVSPSSSRDSPRMTIDSTSPYNPYNPSL